MASWHYLAVLLLSLCISCYSQVKKNQTYGRFTAKVEKLPLQICGASSDTVFEKKIINGEPAELGTYPWMAAIGYSLFGQGPYWSCGGSLVTDQYVLTAAHCLDLESIQAKRPFEVSIVRLGDLNLDDSVNDTAIPVDMEVGKVIFHESYDRDIKTNDIGLIRLKEKIEFTDLIKPICLPPPEFYRNDFVGFTSVVAGWGRATFDPNAIQVTHLQEAEVEIQEVDECKTNITRVLPRSVIDDKVLCASSPGKDSCQGDSGGPLMIYRRHNDRAAMFVLGVVSYGWKCAEEGYPGIYTRVVKHMPWILDNLDI